MQKAKIVESITLNPISGGTPESFIRRAVRRCPK
jgi:hypothetical protein